MREEVRRRVGESELVAAAGAYAIPLAFYFDRPVVAVETDDELRRLTAGDPRRVAIVTDEMLDRAGARDEWTVLWRDRLGRRPVSVVGGAGPPAPAGPSRD